MGVIINERLFINEAENQAVKWQSFEGALKGSMEQQFVDRTFKPRKIDEILQ